MTLSLEFTKNLIYTTIKIFSIIRNVKKIIPSYLVYSESSENIKNCI